MDRATPPEERRAGLARMKQTLVTARMGLDDLRGGVRLTRERLATEQRQLETMRRRKGLAAGINDAETVALAEKYEAHHAERVAVLVRKLEAQEAELAIAERDVAEMTAELKNASLGMGSAAGPSIEKEAAAEAERAASGDASRVAEEFDAMGRARARADRDAEAARKLEELKRRMGK
ncbi:MAG TPA: hypothetical protein VGG84_11130 [Gemmatimonadaceae bacterium]